MQLLSVPYLSIKSHLCAAEVINSLTQCILLRQDYFVFRKPEDLDSACDLLK